MLLTLYLMLNVINWNNPGLNNIVPRNASEHNYFVLTADSNGNLLGTDTAEETKFISDVHAGGKKATFSLGGAAQDPAVIKTAVTSGTGLVTAVANHIRQFGYDGVVLDIEDTSIDAQKMVDFVSALRVGLDGVKPNLILGIDVEPYQLTTVWAKIEQASTSITWLSPMLYNIGFFDAAKWTSLNNAWLTKVPKEKLLAGLAVNYKKPKGGLTTSQYSQMLDITIANGWKGVAIWNNDLYTQNWINVTNSKVLVQ